MADQRLVGHYLALRVVCPGIEGADGTGDTPGGEHRFFYLLGAPFGHGRGNC